MGSGSCTDCMFILMIFLFSLISLMSNQHFYTNIPYDNSYNRKDEERKANNKVLCVKVSRPALKQQLKRNGTLTPLRSLNTHTAALSRSCTDVTFKRCKHAEGANPLLQSIMSRNLGRLSTVETLSAFFITPQKLDSEMKWFVTWYLFCL